MATKQYAISLEDAELDWLPPAMRARLRELSPEELTPRQKSLHKVAGEIVSTLKPEVILKMEAILRAGEGANRENIFAVYGQVFDMRSVVRSVGQKYAGLCLVEQIGENNQLFRWHSASNSLQDRLFIDLDARQAFAKAIAAHTGSAVPLGPVRALMRENGGGVDLTTRSDDPLPQLRPSRVSAVLPQIKAATSSKPSATASNGVKSVAKTANGHEKAQAPATAKPESATTKTAPKASPSARKSAAEAMADDLSSISPLLVPAAKPQPKAEPAPVPAPLPDDAFKDRAPPPPSEVDPEDLSLAHIRAWGRSDDPEIVPPGG